MDSFDKDYNRIKNAADFFIRKNKSNLLPDDLINEAWIEWFNLNEAYNYEIFCKLFYKVIYKEINSPLLFQINDEGYYNKPKNNNKICVTCQNVLPLNSFYLITQLRQRYSYECIDCTNKRATKWYHNNKKRVLEYKNKNQEKVKVYKERFKKKNGIEHLTNTDCYIRHLILKDTSITKDYLENHPELFEKKRAELIEHRLMYGNNKGKTKLTISDVIDIKSMIGLFTLQSIADKFGVTYHTIYHIKKGNTWADVKI